jgi:hypothetical protein
MNPAEVEEARRLVDQDWLVTRAWNRLHHATLTNDQLQVMYDDRFLTAPVKLTCGRTAAYVSIPGILTRIGAERCIGCCTALGYPQGAGSPKNVDACREVLGLPASGAP